MANVDVKFIDPEGYNVFVQTSEDPTACVMVLAEGGAFLTRAQVKTLRKVLKRALAADLPS